MHKCPNCRFEPVDGLATCPNCGFSLVSVDDTLPEDKNDEIEWSELSQLSVESVREMFAEDKADDLEENVKTQNEDNADDTNPILAQYIREHKGEYIPRRDVEPNKEEKTEAEKNEPDGQQAAESLETSEEAIKSEAVEPVVAESPTVDKILPTEPETVVPVLAENTSSEENEQASETEAKPQEPNFGGGNAYSGDNEPPKKSHKKWYITLAAVALLGIGGGYYYHTEKEAEAQRVAAVKKENKEIDTLEETIQEFYTDDKQVFIRADKIGQNTSKLAEEIAKHKDSSRYKELDTSYERLLDKMNSIQEVNLLFTSPAIDGDKVADNLQLKADQPVDLAVNTGDQSFNDLLNQAISQAKDQYEKIEEAKKALSQVIQDGSVLEGVTREQYNSANDALNAVTNQTLVETQKADLKKVDDTLTEKEKKAEEERLAAEKAAQEKAEQEKAAQERQKSTTNSGGPNQPIVGSDSDQTADLSNAAWGWNPGVKEKVIQTCLSRGYITEGGYYVEPARIENGEGYYNLYATTNQASLTKNLSPSDLPMYVVTINCKTGWFKGNGGN
ncbi:cell division site-positioning protein MapZ family protein [Candidatus Enterococcus ferrettii]|uniref:Mid-cell-anchored protein Z n=1 Tax=Candidatus Enterococcus ferrettii TaxID=2815324 RepID=A0ABV0EZ71_9ENTE|nr:cell division site-positioning protein MapZ family protein [Enterococcus sp. 665A]MBO1342139.1 zinc ribbon domain-containing protein [Enterococcus sp. 665A]